MRKVYLIIVLLIAVGIVASLYLIPSEKEVAVINYKEQVYDFNKDAYKAKESLLAQLESGDLSVDVVSALVDIYLQEGNVDEAINITERFVEENPTNIEARKQLGTLYQYAQRPDDYIRNLEEIKRISGNKDITRNLSDIYNFNEDYAKQADALRELIEQKEQLEPHQFVELANIMASNQNTEEAISVLQTLRQNNPDQMPFDALQLLVSLLMDKAQYEEAYNESVWWRGRTKNIEEVARLANIMHYKGAPEKAQEFIDPYAETIFEYKPLVFEQVQLHLTFGRDEEAYAMLTRLYQDDALPADLLDSYLLLALKRGDDELVDELSQQITADNIDEIQAISLVELASITNKRSLLNRINDQLGTEEYLDAHPLFEIVLNLALRKAEADENIEEYAAGDEITDQHRLIIARNCARVGKNGCAERFIEELSEGDMNNARLAVLGNLYIDMKYFKRGMELMDQYRSEDTTADVERVWVKLAAANGRDEEVIDWLARNEALTSESLLTDLYFLASDNSHDRLSLAMAELLYERANTSDTRTYLANAYMRNGQFPEALELLEQEGELSDDAIDAYLGALVSQARKDPSYRQPLAEFASEMLSSGRLSERRKLALIYALIDAGRSDIAMPYVRQYALSRGGEWAFLYAENLNKAGKYEEARDFWMLAAQQPHITIDEKRSIAFTLLDKGFREDALSIFSELAKDAGPESDDVKQLLYIWGPRLSGDQLNWLYSRAVTAEDAADRQLWVKYLLDYASAEDMVALVEQHPDSIRHPAILNTYMESLYELKRDNDMALLFNTLKDDRFPPETIRQYARAARDYGLEDSAEMAFKQLHRMIPNDQEALREVGVMAFGEADYSDAKEYLADYLILRQHNQTPDKDAYLAYYYYGELLRREDEQEESLKYYQATMDVVAAEPFRTADMESKALQSQIHLGNVEGGLAGFVEAMKRYPDDPVLKGDFISALVELKRYDDARAVLASPHATMTSGGAGLPLKLSGNQFTAYKLLNNRKELLLAFNPAQADEPAISSQSVLAYDWMGFVSQGYDRVLVTAKPEYTMEVVRTKDGSVMIIPQKDESRAAQHLDAQARLRYELLNARMDIETGNHYEAVERLNELMPQYPNDAQLLGYTANAENYVGRWHRALRLLREAEALSPENEDIEDLKRDIEKLHAQHIKLDHEWRMLGDNDEQITTISGFATVSDGLDVGAEVQNNFVDSANGIRRADGRIGQFEDDRQRAEIFARYVEEDGTTYKASVFANNDTVGLGGYFSFINWLGQTGVDLEYHRPYWEFVEGVLDDATRDRAALHHMARIDQDITVNGGVSLNRYNVDGDTDVASSVGIEGGVTYQVSNKPYVALIYGLDAEYELDHQDRIDGTGASFRPFPFRSREVHSVAVAGTYNFTKQTYIDYLLGYGYDRLGGNGPLGELRFTHEITDDLEFQARAFHGIGNGETDDDITRIGAHLLYRY